MARKGLIRRLSLQKLNFKFLGRRHFYEIIYSHIVPSIPVHACSHCIPMVRFLFPCREHPPSVPSAFRNTCYHSRHRGSCHPVHAANHRRHCVQSQKKAPNESRSSGAEARTERQRNARNTPNRHEKTRKTKKNSPAERAGEHDLSLAVPRRPGRSERERRHHAHIHRGQYSFPDWSGVQRPASLFELRQSSAAA